MSLIKIVIYHTYSKKQPFLEWHNALDSKVKEIVASRLTRLNLGNFGDCKFIKDGAGIWELRIDYGPGYRIYFGKIGTAIVILLCGGDKGSQQKDIMKAKQYWLDYKESMHE